MIAIIAISALFTGCKKGEEETTDPVLVEKHLLVNWKMYDDEGVVSNEYVYEHDDLFRVITQERICHYNDKLSYLKEFEYDAQDLLTESKTFNNNKLRYHEVFSHNELTIESIRYLVDTITQEEEIFSRSTREYNSDGYLVRTLSEDDDTGMDYWRSEIKYFYDDLNNRIKYEIYGTVNGVVYLRSVRKDIVYDDKKSPYLNIVTGWGDRSYQAGNEVFLVGQNYHDGELVSEKEYVTNIEYNDAGYPLKKIMVVDGNETIQEFEYKIVVVEE
jgi:hypothetical protein